MIDHDQLPNHPHRDRCSLGGGGPTTLLLTGERNGPESIGVAAARSLCVEADLSRGKNAAFDGVDLGDHVPIAGQDDITALEQDLEVGGPTLLGLVTENLGCDLGIVAGEVLRQIQNS